jgi:hypothetical protein
MIRPTVVALAMCVASAAQSMPYVPFRSRTIRSFQFAKDVASDVNWSMASACLTRRCVQRSASATLEKCMVNGRCEPRVRPAAASGTAQPAARQLATRYAALINPRRR